MIAGVCGGIADHLGVDAFRVRVVFVVLSAFSGGGVLGYALLWAFVPVGDDTAPVSPSERRQAWGLALIGGALGVVLGIVSSGAPLGNAVALIVVVGGAALVWREVDVTGIRSGASAITWLRVLAGAALVIGGLVAIVMVGDPWGGNVSRTILAVLATLLGVVVLTVPMWRRMLRALNEERDARVRQAERQEIASHLHDSVLQTLALIQKQADRPETVVRLARGQERELRTWLFDDRPQDADSLAAAIAAAGAAVESDYGLEVETVTVGDLTPAELHDPELRRRWLALLGATREALVNAAKHAGADKADVYAEVTDEEVEVFVRDRGAGFDPTQVDPDRQGIAGSIESRMRRVGGHGEVRSRIGRGTNVVLTVPRAGHETIHTEENA